MTIENLPIKHLLRPISRIDVYDLNGSPTGYLQRILDVKYTFGNITCVYSRDPLKTLPIGFSDNIFRPMMHTSDYVNRTLLGLSGDKDVLIVTIDIDGD